MRLLKALLCLSVVAAAQVYLDNLPTSHPAIRYAETTPDDAAAHLARDLDCGKVTLRGDPATGYLPALLAYFKIPADSQMLVFSKSSFQARKISPRNPRAVFFNDEVAIGYVRGGDSMEIAATDPHLGTVFYTFDGNAPKVTRQTVCLKCHQGPSTLGIPGIFIGSVFPNLDGMPAREGAIVTDYRTPFRDRWGGWYVNAARGEQPDRANSIAPDPAAPEELQRLTFRFSPRGYLSSVSDIVALMTFEHQTQMTDYLTRLNWETRIYGQPNEADLEAAVSYMLFTDETPLPAPIEGVSGFTKTFPLQGPRDSHGRSLRDFDLRTRLFRYPLSYMIYSRAFDALPGDVRVKIYRKLHDELIARHREDVIAIVRDTKAGLPDFW